MVAVTSGHSHSNGVDEFLFIYKKIDGQWIGQWEDIYEGEAGSLYDALQDYKEMVETWLAVQCLNRHKPKILTRITKFRVNGRERTYRPIQGLPGVYKVSWWVDGERACEIRALTVREYRNFTTI